MKLALKAVPYRALQKTTTLLISAVFIASIGVGVPVGPPQFLAVAVGSFLLSLGYEVAYYRRFEYELTDDTLDIRSGVFNRREREIPYGRVQNVDISRNIFQRLVGLSKLDIETAGGGSTEASLKYVTAFEANRLQLDIRRYKRGESPESHAEGATVADTDLDRDRAVDDEELLFEIAPSELALAGILSFDPRVPGALIALFTGSVPFISPIIPFDAPPLIVFGLLAVLFAAGLVLAWIVGAISAIVNYWGFRLTRSEGELRYERGLLQRYSGTIPFDKIQAITITDNPLKRRAGYATLVVETAGYAPGQTDGRGSEAAVPIGSRDRVDRLADEISSIEKPTFNRPPKRIRRRYLVRYLLAIAGMTGLLYAGLTVFDLADAMPWYLPAVAALGTPLAAHYKWLHRGYWLGEDHLVTRNGFWSRETKQVAYYRIQTVIETRTIFQRRWSVATVIADTAGSLSILGTGAAAVDIDHQDATRLRETLTERLRTALAERRRDRQRSTAFEWVDTKDEERSDSTGASGNGQDVDQSHTNRSDDSPSDVDRSDDDSSSRK
ncbi:PH domain-containing protein [Halohasta litorea]|uniref:PH domain-containing protein n=1 Tax=Halohasta litorea TaxID=869891 RepID=A0ABD6D717_9EURY|nr:PH domain-containing protein [Halohasta litorea]